MLRHFDRDIEDIKDLLLRMGAMVEDSINQSIRALLDRDTSMAEDVIRRDDEVDKMENLIDEKRIDRQQSRNENAFCFHCLTKCIVSL